MSESAELFEGMDRLALRLSLDEPDDLRLRGGDWLLVGIEARSGNRVWSEEDTCLTVTDVENLAAWAEAVADLPSDGAKSLAFRESNLRFIYDGAALPNRIRIDCDLEFAPPEWKNEEPFEFSFARDPAQLRAFATNLRQQLAELREDAEDMGADEPLLPKAPRPIMRR